MLQNYKYPEESAYYGENKVYLRFLTKDEFSLLSDALPTTSHCFPIKNEEVLFTKNPRGVDIIGGHIEPGENAIEALFRESLEEACIVPTQYEFIGAIQVDNRDSPKAIEAGYPPIGYQMIYLISEYKELDFVPTHECVGRQYIHTTEVAKVHHHWLETHQQALNEAIQKLKKQIKIKP